MHIPLSIIIIVTIIPNWYYYDWSVNTWDHQFIVQALHVMSWFTLYYIECI